MQPLGNQCPGTGWASRYRRSSTHPGVAGDQDVSRASEFDQRVARCVHACRERGQNVVGPTDDQCGARGQSGGLRCGTAQFADLGAWTVNGCEGARVEIRGGDDGLRDVSVDGEQPRLQRPVLFYVDVCAEGRQHPVVGADVVRRAVVDVGLVGAQPRRRRRDRLLSQRRTRHGDEVHVGQRQRELGHLPVRPGIVLEDGPPQRFSVGVERHDCGNHARDGDGAVRPRRESHWC